MRWGLRARLLIVGLIPPLVVSLLLGGYLLDQRIRGIQQHLTDHGPIVAAEIAPLAGNALRNLDRNALRRVADAALRDPSLAAVTITDSDGNVLLHRQNTDTGEPVSEGMSLLLDLFTDSSVPLSYRAPITRADEETGGESRPLGWVTIDLRMGPSLRTQSENLTSILVLMGIALAVSALFSLLANRMLVRPLHRLTTVIGRLEDGDLEARVSRIANGELGQLERAVNRMAVAMQNSQQELSDQIEQATMELRETLEAVEIQNVELDIARKRALEGSKVKSEFLANMSHEIRTPINGILGFADLLSHSQLDDEQKEYVSTIKESCANLLTIVNDILDFSKMEAGKLVIDNVAFDLRDCVEEVLSLMAPTAYGKSLELVHLIYSDVPLKLYGDPIRIRQVLTNLVHNAVKFTPRGRVVVRVMLDEETEGEAVLRITVTDTGIGLSASEQQKLFKAFSQADTTITRRFGGAGLGLIICRKLLEQMGGTIGLESEPENGSTFWFTLRCAKQRTPESGQSAGQRENPLKGARLLLYDEEALSRLAIKHIFESWEMQVTEIDDRQSFVSLICAESHWDLAVVGLTRADLNKRQFHGLMPRIRHVDVPLVVLASSVDRNELRSLFHQGARACLPKAARRQTLYRELCRLLTTDHTPALPLEPLLDKPEEPAAMTPSPARSAPFSKINALVVDDNRINRKLVTTILSRHGLHPDEAEDGGEAVDMACAKQYDVIFMDIHMPTMSGETATARIRQHQADGPASHFIALTANAMPGEKERLLRAGFDRCLIKPITEEQVLAILAEALPGATAPVAAGESPDAAAEAGSAAENGRKPLVDELRDMLIAELPSHKRTIQEAYRDGDLKNLKDYVHKLHGAASVCQVPKLKSACADLERTIADRQRVHIPAGVDRLLKEIQSLLEITQT